MTVGYLAEVVIQAASDDDSWGKIGLVFLASGPAFFWAMYIRYRNTDKRNKHEAETKAEMDRVQGTDVFVKSMKGLSNSRMPRANNNAVHGARKGVG